MTTTSTEFRRYMDENEALPPDCMLGYFVWSTVEEAAYDASILERLFMQFMLNPKFLPGPINPADAFEKACTACHGFRYEPGTGLAHALGAGNTVEILIREASRDKFSITRKMIREIKDSRGKKLHHDEVGELVFYRPATVNGAVDHNTARVRTTLVSTLELRERTALEPLVQKFDNEYHRFKNFHDGQRIRKIIREYLLHLNAILMKPSVYFVHQTRSKELEGLRQFVNALNPGSGTKMSLIPLPDLGAMREEVTDAFQREAEKDLLEIVADIQKLRQVRRTAIRPEAYAKIKEKYDEVISKAREHSRTLQTSQDRTGSAAELALNALYALQSEVMEAQVNAHVAATAADDVYDDLL